MKTSLCLVKIWGLLGSAPGWALEHCIGPHARKHNNNLCLHSSLQTFGVTSYIHSCYQGYWKSLSHILFFFILFSLWIYNLYVFPEKQHWGLVYTFSTIVEFNTALEEHCWKAINFTSIVQLAPLLILLSQVNADSCKFNFFFCGVSWKASSPLVKWLKMLTNLFCLKY